MFFKIFLKLTFPALDLLKHRPRGAVSMALHFSCM